MTAPLWTYEEILEATGGKGSGSNDVYGIAIDSRDVVPGDLFLALSGDQTDGHNFVKEALANGAGLALISKLPKGFSKSDPRLVWVHDTYKAMLELAVVARDRVNATIIAVTGTAGKTSTKDVLAKAFSKQGKTHAAVKSFNNHVGVPLTLARMPRDTKFGIFEVGMNAPGNIAPLSILIQPDVALITNVGKGHTAAFANEEEIAAEKAAIFSGMEPGGTAVLNCDNRHFDLLKKLAKQCGVEKIMGFSAITPSTEAHLIKNVPHENCSCVRAMVGDTTVIYKTPLPGDHWVENSLGILLTTHAAGGDLGLAGLALAGLQPRAGRGSVHEIQTGRGPVQVVDESYNANPLSLKAALKVFENKKPVGSRGRKIAVLGDMEELGESSMADHLDLAADIQAAGVEVLYVVGPGMTALLEKLKPQMSGFTFSDPAGICQKLGQDLTKGDVILVKGSRLAGLDQVVDHLTDLEIKEATEAWGSPMAVAG